MCAALQQDTVSLVCNFTVIQHAMSQLGYLSSLAIKCDIGLFAWFGAFDFSLVCLSLVFFNEFE